MAAPGDPWNLYAGEARVLPNGAVRFSVQSDNQGRQYLTLINTPVEPYVVDHIHDGYEFVVGGDRDSIIEQLWDMINSRPPGTWHIIAVPESSIQRSNAPRWPRWPHDVAPQQGRPQQQLDNNNNGVMQSGPVDPLVQAPPTRVPSIQAPSTQAPSVQVYNDLASVGATHSHALDSPAAAFNAYDAHGVTILPNNTGSQDTVIRKGSHQAENRQFQGTRVPINNPVVQGGTIVRHVNFSNVPTRQGSNVTAARNYMPTQSTSLDPASKKKNPHQFTNKDAENFKHFEAWARMHRRQAEIDAILDADEDFSDYTGTDLCRWCGRYGHEAIDCIKFDHTHFDKLVCVACNNKKHCTDECWKFSVDLTQEQQAALLLGKGADVPGVRSCFCPWTSYLVTKNYEAYPASREYLIRLVASDSSRDWHNLWKTWDYDGSNGAPYSTAGSPRANWHFVNQFRDKISGHFTAGLDETFHGWPLFRRQCYLLDWTGEAAGPNMEQHAQDKDEHMNKPTDEQTDEQADEQADEPTDE